MTFGSLWNQYHHNKDINYNFPICTIMEEYNIKMWNQKIRNLLTLRFIFNFAKESYCQQFSFRFMNTLFMDFLNLYSKLIQHSNEYKAGYWEVNCYSYGMLLFFFQVNLALPLLLNIILLPQNTILNKYHLDPQINNLKLLTH